MTIWTRPRPGRPPDVHGEQSAPPRHTPQDLMASIPIQALGAVTGEFVLTGAATNGGPSQPPGGIPHHHE